MGRTLIVYQQINNDEEPTSLYLVPNEHISDKMRAWLEEAHNKIINCDEMNNGMEFLNSAVSTKRKYVDDKWADYACIFNQYKMNMDKSWNNSYLDIDYLYMTGFVY